MNRISFAETTAQVEDESKTVTRRLGWKKLNPGARLLAVDKIRVKGARVLKVIEVVSVREERLSAITDDDLRREGFPGRDAAWFIAMFMKKFFDSLGPARTRDLDPIVTRIEFRYVKNVERAVADLRACS